MQLYLLSNDDFINRIKLKGYMGLGLRDKYNDFICRDYEVTVFYALASSCRRIWSDMTRVRAPLIVWRAASTWTIASATHGNPHPSDTRRAL